MIFLKTDLFVLNKLKQSKDREIISNLKNLENIKVKEVDDDYNFTAKNKLRYVDPKVIVDNEFYRVSELFPNYANKINLAKQKAKKGFKIKVF